MKLDEQHKHGGELRMLERLLRGVPRLPGAACIGQHNLFDSEDKAAQKAATAICSHCPALNPCRAWRAGLSATQRPHGVVAGMLRHTTNK